MSILSERAWHLGTTLAFVAALLMVSGCSASRQSTFEDGDQAAEGAVEGDFVQTLEAAREHWQNRQDRAELENAISLWSEAVQMDAPGLSAEEKTDKKARAYENLSRAYFFLADSHIRLQGDDEAENKDQMMATFEKGVTAAEQAIKLRDPSFAEKVGAGESWQEHVSEAHEAAIPGLYWYATNLGKWALLEGIATILARKDDIMATMELICEEDEDFFYGACHRYFGVYWTKVPFNKDPEKAKKHFDRALEIAPDYVATKVLMAENYAVLTGDRELYDRLVTEAMQTPDDADPAIGPENHFQKLEAQRLADTADDRFSGERSKRSTNSSGSVRVAAAAEGVVPLQDLMDEVEQEDASAN